jgi:hypothetical protein
VCILQHEAFIHHPSETCLAEFIVKTIQVFLTHLVDHNPDYQLGFLSVPILLRMQQVG